MRADVSQRMSGSINALTFSNEERRLEPTVAGGGSGLIGFRRIVCTLSKFACIAEPVVCWDVNRWDALAVLGTIWHIRRWLPYLVDTRAGSMVRRGGLEPPGDCSR